MNNEKKDAPTPEAERRQDAGVTDAMATLDDLVSQMDRAADNLPLGMERQRLRDFTAVLGLRVDLLRAALALPAAQDGDYPANIREAMDALDWWARHYVMADDYDPKADVRTLTGYMRLQQLPTPNAIRGDKGAEAVDAECPFCPVEIRNLHAVAHNCVVGYPYKLDIDELRRAVEMARPFADRHFADRAHSHPEHGKPRKPLERVVEAICDVFPAPTQAAAKDTP